MKRILLLFALFLSLGAMAQSSVVLLYPTYKQGTVYLKGGTRVRVPLNYDAASHVMRYEDNGQIMELQNVQDVDSVSVDGHRFIVLGNRFCEFIPSRKSPDAALLIDWTLIKVHVGYKGAMGTISQVKGERISVSKFAAGMAANEGTPDAAAQYGTGNNSSESQDVYRQRNSNNYFIWNKGKTTKFRDKKGLLKIYSDRKDEVEAALKKHHTEFQRPESVVAAVLELI